MTVLGDLIRDFAALLTPNHDNDERLILWIDQPGPRTCRICAPSHAASISTGPH